MAEAGGVRRAPGDAAALSSRANLAAVLTAVAVAVYVLFIAIDAQGPIWMVQGGTALAAAAVGWRARTGALPRGRALVAVVIGALLFASFVIFAIIEA